MNDVTHVCSTNTHIGLFADDAKVFSTDPQSLQQTLTSMCQFLENRQLILAEEKCEKITISKYKDSHELHIGNTKLHESNFIRDLEIHISSNLRGNEHIMKIKAKAFQRARLVLSSFNSRCVWILKKAYICYVRPIMEYGSIIESIPEK